MTLFAGGGPRVTFARIESAPVSALAALFDDGLPVPARGEPLPPLWHWVALAQWFGALDTGPDGHQKVGGHLPDVGKPRRMFAGGRVEVFDNVLVDDEVRREDQVRAVLPKSGRQGDFVVVQLETSIYNAHGRLAIRDRQDLIYRDPPQGADGAAPDPQQAKPMVPALLRRANDGWVFETDPTKLLRFSSATSNGHRIHYDHPYATQVEGYPDLVVHGPLMTLALVEVLRLDGRRAPAKAFTHRALRPLYCGQSARVELQRGDGDETEATLRTAEGAHSTLLASG